MRPEVIVHHLAQAKAALAAADDAGFAIQLRSAAGAATAAGVGYLRALGEAAGHELLIDCGDDAGLVMAALRSGCRKLLFSGSEDERKRLGQMAERVGAVLVVSAALPDDRLALSPDDAAADALRTWLASRPAS
ncbi:MAG: hypothetical protein ACR2RA_15530 [Geminicoccaceae bacterium]